MEKTSNEDDGPRLLNVKTAGRPKGAVYIGRGTKWGNPFIIGIDGDRQDVCDKYEEWIQQPEQSALRLQIEEELKGRTLLCHCAPLRCHGETLFTLANLNLER